MIDIPCTWRSTLLVIVLTAVAEAGSDRILENYQELVSTVGNKESLNITQLINNGSLSKEEETSMTETCPSSMQEFVSPVQGRPRCCRKCKAGTGMLRLCTDSKDTLCWPCEPGLEFAPTSSATAKCFRCRRCQELHPLAKVRTPCTPTSNTVCECRPGYFMSADSQSCRPCSVCQPGEAVFRPCEWNSDTQCQACPRGFWSAKSLDSVKCIPCRSCPADQLIVRECSGDSNTRCCPRSDPNCTSYDLAVQNGPITVPSDVLDEYGTRGKHTQMLPIYCAFMGLIIVCLILYVAYKLWKQHTSGSKNKLTDIFGVEENRCGSEYKFSQGHHLLQDPSVDLPHRSGKPAKNNEGSISSSSSGRASQRSSSGDPGRRRSANEEDRQLLTATRCNEVEPLSGLPVLTLGMLCYQLSLKGWRAVAATFGVTEYSLALPWRDGGCDNPYYSTTLMQSAISVAPPRSSLESRFTQDDDLVNSVRLMEELCNRTGPVVSIMTFSAALRQAGRVDLLRTLSPHPTSDEFAKTGVMTTAAS